MDKEKKVPMRTCVSCRKTQEKKTMQRIVRGPDGRVEVDTTGKKPGRGAYVCFGEDCLKRAIKTGAISRALRASGPETLADELEKIKGDIEAKQ